jgi:nucleotidyltransferase substrate binding protein (TIGR01987 family)
MANYFTRLEAFKDSLNSLAQIETIAFPSDDVLKGFVWCGVIAKYSITLDLSWKLMKDVLIQYHKVSDFAKGSPKEVMQKSYEADIINDHTWAEMLQDRNDIAHQYKNLDAVDEWCAKIVQKYIPLFRGLSEYAEAKLNEQ